MNDIPYGKTPEAFGEDVAAQKIATVFERVLAGATELVLFDGTNDYDSRVLSYLPTKSAAHVLIIDDTTPPLPKYIYENKDRLLGRVQYFQSGLHHRISFQSIPFKRGIYVGHPAVWLQIIPPLRRVSNLYVAMPGADHPVLLEIPVAGAPPQVRVIELSSKRLKVYAPEAKKLFPEATTLEGLDLQLVDIGKAQIDGIMRAVSREHAELEITKMDPPSQDLLDEFLNRDFLRTQSRTATAYPAEVPEATAELTPSRTEPNTALVIVEKATVRERYIQVLQQLGYKVNQCTRFELASPDIVRGRSLLVMDSIQSSTHAESWLEAWIQDGLLQPGHFILISDGSETDQRDLWEKLGKGLRLRSSYPAEWISNRLKEWLQPGPPLGEGRDSTDANVGTTSDDSSPLILAVDDEPDMREVIKDVLGREGYRVHTASNGRDAVRMARNGRYDLILLDLHMPQYDGISTLETLRQFSATRETPVIVITGYYHGHHVKKVTELGISAFITKPFNPFDLLESIRKNLVKGSKRKN